MLFRSSLTDGDTVDFSRVSATRSRAAGTANAVEFDSPSTQLIVNSADANNYTLNFNDLADAFNPSNGIDINGNTGDDIITITDLGDTFGNGATGTLDIDTAASANDSVTFQTVAQSFATLSVTARTITGTSAAIGCEGAMALDASAAGTITLTNAQIGRAHVCTPARA